MFLRVEKNIRFNICNQLKWFKLVLYQQNKHYLKSVHLLEKRSFCRIDECTVELGSKLPSITQTSWVVVSRSTLPCCLSRAWDPQLSLAWLLCCRRAGAPCPQRSPSAWPACWARPRARTRRAASRSVAPHRTTCRPTTAATRKQSTVNILTSQQII